MHGGPLSSKQAPSKPMILGCWNDASVFASLRNVDTVYSDAPCFKYLTAHIIVLCVSSSASVHLTTYSKTEMYTINI